MSVESDKNKSHTTGNELAFLQGIFDNTNIPSRDKSATNQCKIKALTGYLKADRVWGKLDEAECRSKAAALLSQIK
jgi:hypothetical protein